jgi:hypothetical protein
MRPAAQSAILTAIENSTEIVPTLSTVSRGGRGAETWAILASLINSAKLQDIDPRHYLTDVLERIVSGRTKINQLHMLLPWNWKAERDGSKAKLAA